MGMIRAAAGIALITLMTTTSAAAEVKTSADAFSEIVTQLGRESYLQYCAACHGLSGSGDGPVGGGLKTAPPDLRSIAARRNGKFPTDEIATIIDGRTMPAVHGTREMPVWGRRFSEQLGGAEVGEEAVRGELLILLEYLRSIQR